MTTMTGCAARAWSKQHRLHADSIKASRALSVFVSRKARKTLDDYPVSIRRRVEEKIAELLKTNDMEKET